MSTATLSVPVTQPQLSYLTEKQQFVMDTILTDDTKTEICMYGSGRSGKTFLAADYVHERAIAYPGSMHLFVRATMNALTGGVVSQTFPNLWRAIERYSGVNVLQAKADNGQPFIYHRAAPHNKFVYYNGSEIRFVGLDVVSTNAAALDKILSQEYLTIVFEEATEIGFEVVELAKSRLAQKVYNAFTGKEAVPKWICTLNPRTFEDWDYIYFQEHKHPLEPERIIADPEKTSVVHFHLLDNIDNVSQNYKKTLESMSTSGQRRFLEGKHGDNFEGEVFKKLYWETMPPIHEFERLMIYTDPSFKSGPKNDYKASALVGKRKGAFWVLNGRAQQTVTSQMIRNVHELAYWAHDQGWRAPIGYWFENAGMPDDFEEAVRQHGINHNWTCPYKLDNRDKGDKYSRIEAALEPLNNNGQLFFNNAFKKERFGQLCVVQFLNFRKKLLPTEHDDVPDAIHGAITLMNLPEPKTGGTSMINKVDRITF